MRYYYRFAGDPRYYAYDWQGIPPGGSRAGERRQLGEWSDSDNYGPGVRYPPLEKKKRRCPPKRAVCVPQLGDCYTSPPIGEGEQHIHNVTCTTSRDHGHRHSLSGIVETLGMAVPLGIVVGIGYLAYKHL